MESMWPGSHVIESRLELGLGMRVLHGVHMVTEIKEYDIRAHGYGMVTLR